jgi:hypothetical protein
MSKSLQELAGTLQDEALPTAGQELDDLPMFGSFAPPPPPGAYRFKLPQDLSSIWDSFPTPEKTPPVRIKAIFDRDHPLVIVSSPSGAHNGEPFETRLTNNERKRGKGGAVIASDLDYLLRACGEKAKPRTNPDYIKVVSRQGGKEFAADVRYNWRCSKDRQVRVRDGNGQLQTIEGKMGCGASYYEEDVEKVNGQVPYEVNCAECGALLRAFANLDNLRA